MKIFLKSKGVSKLYNGYVLNFWLKKCFLLKPSIRKEYAGGSTLESTE